MPELHFTQCSLRLELSEGGRTQLAASEERQRRPRRETEEEEGGMAGKVENEKGDRWRKRQQGVSEGLKRVREKRKSTGRRQIDHSNP